MLSCDFHKNMKYAVLRGRRPVAAFERHEDAVLFVERIKRAVRAKFGGVESNMWVSYHDTQDYYIIER
jgi:hypothetical protein